MGLPVPPPPPPPPEGKPLRQAMLLAAGRGARMRPLTDRIPKPLQKVQGKPLIAWQLEALSRAGIHTVVINTCWLGEQIESFVGDGSPWGLQVHWSREDQALGTAGGIATALPWLSDPAFLVVSADIFTYFEYAPLLQEWARPASSCAHLLMVQDARYPCDFALQAGRIHLPRPDLPGGTYGNIGIYRRAFFESLAPHQELALGPLLRQAAAAGKLTGQWCRVLWENVGTVEDLARLNSGTLKDFRATFQR